MWKKQLIKVTLVAIMSLGAFMANAQSDYQSAVGLGLDFGEGRTFVGPSFKHFFNARSAGDAELLFGGRTTMVNLLYQYHGDIENATGLKWFAGIGPSILFGSGYSDVAIRPMAGLDYKFKDVPLSFSLDWRPYIGFGDGDGFLAGRFGLGFRYVIN